METRFRSYTPDNLKGIPLTRPACSFRSGLHRQFFGNRPPLRTFLVASGVIILAVALVPLLGQQTSAFATSPPSTLLAGQVLTGGQTLASSNGLFLLAMQTDGNLVEYGGNRALWSSNTYDPGSHAVMQGDGNLVVYSSANIPLWDSQTSGHISSSYFLALQPDGNLVIYGSSGALWANYANPTTLYAGESLASGQSLISAGNQFALTMAANGNLVESMGTQDLWSSNTAGSSGAYALLTTNGSLDIYSSAGALIWSSNASGQPSTQYQLKLQPDANLVTYGPAGAMWANYSKATQLQTDQTLTSGQFLISANGEFVLTLFSNGNLVETFGSSVIWSTGTTGYSGDYLVMQGDGNLVLYSASGSAIWDSQSSGPTGTGYFLALQPDGNLVVYSPSAALWANYVQPSQLRTDQTLFANQGVTSPNGLYTLTMQANGDLTEYFGTRLLWSSGTPGNAGAYAVMQADGNLVVYAASGVPLFDTQTSGALNAGYFLALQSDGNLVIYSSGGAVWADYVSDSSLRAGGVLTSGQELLSQNGSYSLQQLSNGNLVEYSGSSIVFQPFSNGTPGDYLTLLANGTVEDLNSAGVVIWTGQQTGGHAPGNYVLSIENDGTLLVDLIS